MARRHPQKGCTCLTCENSRAYSRQQKKNQPPGYYHQLRENRTEAQHAQHMKTQRARRRRAADQRDAQRLIDLARRAT